MTAPAIRSLGVAVLAGLTFLPALVPRMTAPANYGAHGLTSGFGRGRLDLQGIVSEGRGGSVDLPPEPVILTVRLSGAGPIHLRGDGVARTILASETPATVRLALERGGPVSIESESRIRLHELMIERVRSPWFQTGLLALLGVVALAAARRGARPALLAAILLPALALVVIHGTLSGVFARIAAVQLSPAVLVLAVCLPAILAFRQSRFLLPPRIGGLGVLAFASALAVIGVQFAGRAQPLPMGDPAAYLEMGGKFADALARLGSPLGLGPILSDLQPYLALPATGLLYGLLGLAGGLGVIYSAQAVAMAVAVAALVSIAEAEIGPRAGRIALALALLHPSFSILPGIVQPEPFILALWSMAALLALRSLRGTPDPRGLLGAGMLLGLGLALHPQGLSFLLLALALCLVPWAGSLVRRPRLIVPPLLGAFSVLLPVAAAEHFSKPLAYVLDKQYGFFAYTSPHPLGFWLYLDSDGWQGPLRIEDTTYQKELIAARGEGAVSSTFADVVAFVARHPLDSARTVLTNLNRLWRQPDNPFAVPFVLPYPLQVWLHRGLVVLFVVVLPALLGSRLALLALPFVMLSLTYPAYHVFNKYGTPALPFIVIGASLSIDRVLRERARLSWMIAGLGCAALGALTPASLFARAGISGDWFMVPARGLVWVGLGVALAATVRLWGSDRRSRAFGGLVGATVLLGSSFAASLTDTTRGTWSVALDQPFDITCRLQAPPEGPPAPAWVLIDARAEEGQTPRLEVNGRALEPPAPTMPTFGLASLRGHRDPATFRQIWRSPIDESVLASGELRIRVSGGGGTRLFGDIRPGASGARLSLGDWPYLSVYRLMHEGEYRLPTKGLVPPQACAASGMAGRPGIFLARIPAGEEARIGLKAAKPLTWVF